MTTSTFTESLRRKHAAGFQAFGLSTLEPRRALDELARFGRERGMAVLAWSSVTGFRPLRLSDDPAIDGPLQEICGGCDDNPLKCVGSPHEALALVGDAYNVLGDARIPARFLTVFIDAHTAFAEHPPLRTRFTDYHLRNWFVTVIEDAATGQVIDIDHPVVFMHPTTGLHHEVDHLIEPLPLPLMRPAEIDASCVEYIKASLDASGSGLDGEEGAQLRRDLSGACAGLLSHQINDVLAMAAREGGRGFTRESLGVVRKYRAELINQSGLVKVYEGGETFKNIGGLGSLTRYVARMLAPRADPLDKPRGILLLGVPGTGKSLVTCALGNETGRVTIELNIGSLMGSHVGESERNIRRALDVIDNSGKAILRLDEVEKALGGVESSARSDGGALMRVFDEFLRWLNDHDSDVYTVMTSNDLSALPPEFSRAGRFDSLWYLDLPSAQARRALWKMYLSKYNLDPKQELPADDEYTGAEIASVARQAYLLNVPLVQAAENVTPVAVRNADKIKALREWAAAAGCLDAEYGGRFNPNRRNKDAQTFVQKGRKIDA